MGKLVNTKEEYSGSGADGRRRRRGRCQSRKSAAAAAVPAARESTRGNCGLPLNNAAANILPCRQRCDGCTRADVGLSPLLLRRRFPLSSSQASSSSSREGRERRVVLLAHIEASVGVDTPSSALVSATVVAAHRGADRRRSRLPRRIRPPSHCRCCCRWRRRRCPPRLESRRRRGR